MNNVLSSILSRIVEILFGILIGTGIFYILIYEEPSFIKMYDLTVTEDIVTIDREIRYPVRANWSVEVFNDEDGLVCNGASKEPVDYQIFPREKVPFPISQYVGDPNCERTLVNGETYTVAIQWIPVKSEPHENVVFYSDFVYRDFKDARGQRRDQ